MSEPTYRPATGADRDELARFLSAHQWPFHARAVRKEAHYRLGWPAQDGVIRDGIGYALLRQDWERGTTTPVDWDGD
jgi:hypothetical protein